MASITVADGTRPQPLCAYAYSILRLHHVSKCLLVEIYTAVHTL